MKPIHFNEPIQEWNEILVRLIQYFYELVSNEKEVKPQDSSLARRIALISKFQQSEHV
jgi:hypothetical protein